MYRGYEDTEIGKTKTNKKLLLNRPLIYKKFYQLFHANMKVYQMYRRHF